MWKRNSSRWRRQWVLLLIGSAVIPVRILRAREPGAPGETGVDAPFRLLLTSFDPFNGEARNGSQEVVKDLKANPAWLGRGIQLLSCNLPVLYDHSAQLAEVCIDHLHPDAVVSLGEAACDLRLETVATNLDQEPGFPDAAGQVRAAHPIVAGGPERIGFRFPLQTMACALGSLEAEVSISTSAGGYVCNNLSYHLARELGPRGIPFTFIHVPRSSCDPSGRSIRPEVKLLARMLRSAVETLRAEEATLGHGRGAGELVENGPEPSDEAEAESLLHQELQRHAPACETQFTTRLVSLF